MKILGMLALPIVLLVAVFAALFLWRRKAAMRSPAVVRAQLPQTAQTGNNGNGSQQTSSYIAAGNTATQAIATGASLVGAVGGLIGAIDDYTSDGSESAW